jgi:hypothetical protein
MNMMRRVLLVALAAGAMLSGAVFAADANVAGEWDFAVETQAGPGNPHFSIKQEGTTLSGTYKGALGEAPITGTVKGNEVTIQFKANAQGADLSVTYQGTVEGDTMKGKVSLGDFGDGTFTGKKVG